ncbi:MAG: peptide chain release factor 2 [Candidatus Omnitrophica bacterium]|nr:peptide chain release factor 2 [Candidatus Omnitrophota bacterium]
MSAEIRARLKELDKRVQAIRVIFDVDKKLKVISDLQDLMSQPSFWQDQNSANKSVEELKSLKADVSVVLDLQKRIEEAQEFLDISNEDKVILDQIEENIKEISGETGQLELRVLLSGEFDAGSAILSINAGAGGTESCDWANMLLRMYSRWAEDKGYKVSTIDILLGEEAGIKNATLLIEGRFAYGYLRCESGVHRLVRISPFDANKRRHTSFASVEALPEIEEDIEIAVNPSDLRVDVYRSSGAGGQSVNTADSAVRITHIPTGIVVSCQNERSQYQNKQVAMKVLKSRLYTLEREKQARQMEQIAGKKQKIEWGSQIRSYVMHPYSMVKDHRTDFQTGNVQAVMDGRLDEFMQAYLRKTAKDSTLSI